MLATLHSLVADAATAATALGVSIVAVEAPTTSTRVLPASSSAHPRPPSTPPAPPASFGCCLWPRPLPSADACFLCLSFAEDANWLSDSSVSLALILALRA